MTEPLVSAAMEKFFKTKLLVFTTSIQELAFYRVIRGPCSLQKIDYNLKKVLGGK
jgi:hypothetical protein